jgi:hypothetical protein
MDKTDVAVVVAVGAGMWAWLGAMFAKLTTLDVKIDMLTRGGSPSSIDVIIGGRRKTDPPMPPPPAVPTVLPVDRRD